MCSGSEAGSYLRPIEFVCHSTLGLSVIKKKKTPAPVIFESSVCHPLCAIFQAVSQNTQLPEILELLECRRENRFLNL